MIFVLALALMFGVLPMVAGIGLIVESKKIVFKVVGGLLLAQILVTSLGFVGAWYIGKGFGDYWNSRSGQIETFGQ